MPFRHRVKFDEQPAIGAAPPKAPYPLALRVGQKDRDRTELRIPRLLHIVAAKRRQHGEASGSSGIVMVSDIAVDDACRERPAQAAIPA